MFGVVLLPLGKLATLKTLSQFRPCRLTSSRRSSRRRDARRGGARYIRELTAAGVRHFYVSNLPIGKAAVTLQRILALV